ncbi:putative CRISPR-associated protein Csc2 [Cooperia oncophora]
MITDCNLAAVSRTKAHGRFREMKEEQAMMLYGFENTTPRLGEASIVRKEKNLHSAKFLTAAAEFEHVTLTTGLSHSGEMLGVQSSSKTPNTASVAAKLHEMSLEHATSVIYLQKMPGIQDQIADVVVKDKHVRGEFLRTRAASDSAVTSYLAIKKETSLPSMMDVQKYLATANTTSSAMRAWASETHVISSTLMLNKGANLETAAVKIRDRHRQEAMTHVAEYGQAQEHCAVMLKNTGGAHGTTSAALAEAVTGGFVDLDTRTTTKSFHLTNYKTMLPPRGEAYVAWPQATLRSASFHLSKLSEHHKLRDENFHQDLRIRRKDAASEVTVYFLYKQVLGNYAMAALGLYLGDRIRKVREEHLTKEVLHTSEKLFQSESHQAEYTDEFERREASRHLVTDLIHGTEEVEKHHKETMTIQEQQQQLQIQTGKLTKPPAQYATATAIAREQQITQAQASMQESKFVEETRIFSRASMQEEHVDADRLIEQIHTERASVRTKGSTEEHVGISVLHLELRDSTDHSQLIRPVVGELAASRQVKEVADESAVGFWATSDQDIQVEGRLLQKSASSHSIERRVDAVSEKETTTEASLEWQPSQLVQGVLREKKEEMVKADFGVESEVEQASLARKSEMAHDYITLSDVETETVRSRAFEFGQEKRSLQGMFGKLTPKPEFAEEVEIERIASVTLQEELLTNASKESATEKELRLRRGDSEADVIAISSAPQKHSTLFTVDASKEESYSMTEDLVSRKPHAESSQVLVKGRSEESAHMQSTATSEMEAFGFWDSNVPAEGVSRTLRTKSYESLVLTKEMRGSTEIDTQLSSELVKEAKEDKAVKWKQAQSASVDRAFGIATQSDEFLISKAMKSAGSTGTLQERLFAKQKQILRQYSDESALLFGSLGSLTPRTPESEQISTSLSDIPVLRGDASIMASSDEIIQTTGKMKRDDSSESAELAKKVSAFQSTSLSTDFSRESSTALNTTYCSESQHKASTQAVLAMAVKDVISLMSPESTEEFVSALWKTGEEGEGAASAQMGMKTAVALSRSISAAGHSFTDFEDEFRREVFADGIVTLKETPIDETSRVFHMSTQDSHVSFSSAPKCLESSRVLPTTSTDTSAAKLREYGRADTGLRSVLGTLSAPPHPHEEAETILLTKEATLLRLGLKASSEHVAELLKLLTKHEQLAEISLIKTIVLEERDRLSVGAASFLSEAITLALEKPSESGNIGAIIAARLQEETTAFMHYATEESVSGVWRSVSDAGEAHSQWPEHIIATAEKKARAPELTSSFLETALDMNQEEAASHCKKLTLTESVQRLFYIELEKALSEISRKEASEAGKATISTSRMEHITGSAKEYDQVETFTQAVVGTIQQPKEGRDTAETTRHRFSLIQTLYATKATKEEHAELLKTLEHYEEHESIGRILEALRTEKLKFSTFSTRTLLKAVEQEWRRAPESGEVSQNVADAVRTVLSLAIKEVVDENAFAIIRSSRTTSEATLVLTLTSVESLVANVHAASELSEQLSSHFLRPMSEFGRSTTIPLQTRDANERKFTVEEQTVTQELGLTPQREGGLSRTFPKTSVEKTTYAAREYAQEHAEVVGELSVVEQPVEQQQEIESVGQKFECLKLLRSIKATTQEQTELVKLLNKYQDDENVAAIKQEIISGEAKFSGIATKQIATSIEQEVSRSSEAENVSAKVADALRSGIIKTLKEMADESTFTIIRTREAASTSTMALVLSLLESADAKVRSPTQETVSKDTVLARESTAYGSTLLPLQSMSTADRRFVISAEVLYTVLQQLPQREAIGGDLRDATVVRAASLVHEQGTEYADVSASLQLLPQPSQKHEETGTTPELSRRLRLVYSTQSSAEEHAELVELLSKFRTDAEVSKIFEDLASEKVKLSKLTTQSIIGSIKELQRQSEIGGAECTVSEAIRNVISKAVKEVAQETAFAIVQCIETNSTAALAKAVTVSESMISHLRAVEQAEVCTTSELSRSLSSAQVSVVPEDHRVYIAERFGISMGSISTALERQGFQQEFSGTLWEKQESKASAHMQEFGQEEVEVMGELMVLEKRPEQQDEVELARKQHSYLQFLHTVKATSEENLDLVKLLSKYDDDEDVAIVIKDLLSGRITFSGIATRTISTAVEKEVERSSESLDISRRVSEVLRSAISKSVKEVVEESAFTILQTQNIVSTAQLALVLSSLESEAARIHAPTEEVTSTDLDFIREAAISRVGTFPIHGTSSVEQRIAINTQVLMSALENIYHQCTTTQVFPLNVAESASSKAREKTNESVEASVSAQLLERSITRDEEAEVTPGTSRRLYFTHSIKSSTEERMELLEMLRKFQTDAEVSKIMNEMISEKIEFSSSTVQSIIHVIKELQKMPEFSGTERAVVGTLRDVISKAIKESVHETSYTILRTMENTRTAKLAMALSACETAIRHLRAVEQNETTITSELSRTLSEVQASVLPEEHRAYVEERFGISAQLLSTALTGQDARQSSMATLQEKQEIKTSVQMKEYGREQTGLTGNITVVEKPQHAQKHAEIITEQPRYLQILHSVRATSEETSSLVKLLKKYEDDEDVATVLRDLVSGRVVLSGMATKTIIATVEQEINRSSQSSDISRRVAGALRAAISAVVREIAEEHAFTILRTKDVISTAQLTMAITALESERANVQYTAESDISTDLDLTQRPRSSLSATLPVRGRSRTERQFAISTQVLTSVLENLYQEDTTSQSIPMSYGIGSDITARERDSKAVEVRVFAGSIPRPPPGDQEVEVTAAVSRRLRFTYNLSQFTEEKKELVELLSKYQDNAEIAAIISDLSSEKIALSSPVTLSIIQAIKDLEKSAETEATDYMVQAIHNVVSEAIKESVHESVLTIVQSVERSSAAKLALALSNTETLISRLRAIERNEVSLVTELTKCVGHAHEVVMPEEHRTYIQERFGISLAAREPSPSEVEKAILSETQFLHSRRATAEETSRLRSLLLQFTDHSDIAKIVHFLSEENVQFSEKLTRDMVGSIEEILSESAAENITASIAARIRMILNDAIRELTDETTFQSFHSTARPVSITTLLVTVHSLESVLGRISETCSEQVSVAAGGLIPPKDIAESHIILEERRLLQLLHLVKASEEERVHLIESLIRYQHHAEINEVLKIIELFNVEMSQRITSQIISTLDLKLSSTAENVIGNVVDNLRAVLTESIREICEETAFSMWRTVEPTASLSTLLITLISLEQVIANVVAPMYSTTSTTSAHERQISEDTTVVVPESIRATTCRKYEADSLEGSFVLKRGEHSEYSVIKRSATESGATTTTVGEIRHESCQAEVGLGILNRPPLRSEEITTICRKQREILLRSTLRATTEEQEQLLESIERTGAVETASQIRNVLRSLSTNISSTVSRDISTTLNANLRHPEDDIKTERQLGEKVKETLTRCLRELTDETMYSLWGTITALETVTLVNSLVLLERVALDAFYATCIRAETSEVFEREGQHYSETTSLVQRLKETVKMLLSDQKTHCESELRASRVTVDTSATLPSSTKLEVLQKAKEFRGEDIRIDAACGRLESPSDCSDFVSTTIASQRKVYIDSTATGTSLKEAQLSADLSSSGSAEMSATRKAVNLKEKVSLDGQATKDIQVAADILIGIPEVDTGVIYSVKDKVTVSEEITAAPATERVIFGTWQSMQTQAFAEILLGELCKELEQIQSAVQASKVTTMEIEQSLSNVQEQNVEEHLATPQKQIDSKKFNIVSQTQTLHLEKSPHIASDFANIPEASKSTTIAQTREFGSEDVNVKSIHGYIQPKPEEAAAVESLVKESRVLANAATVSATTEESTEHEATLNRTSLLEKTQITSVTNVIDSSSLEAYASREEEMLEAMTLAKIEQKSHVERVDTEKSKLEAAKTVAETQDEALYGLWRTLDENNVMASAFVGVPTREQLQKSVHAAAEEHITTSSQFCDTESADISTVVKLQRSDSAGRAFAIEKQQCESTLHSCESTASSSSLLTEVLRTSEKAAVREFGAAEVDVGGAVGYLTPRKADIAETSMELADKRRLHAIKTMAASSDLSVEGSETISRSQAVETVFDRKILSNQAQTSLSAAASSQEISQTEFKRSKGSASYGVGKSLPDTRKERVTISGSETTESSVFGIWDSTIEMATSQKILRGKSLESTDMEFFTEASREETIKTDVEFKTEPRHITTSLLPETQKEGDSRLFTIENQQFTTSYQRYPEGGVASKTEKDIRAISTRGTAREYGMEQAEMAASVGFIEPRKEEFDGASAKFDTGRKLEVVQKMKASEDVTVEGSLSLWKTEPTVDSARTIQEILMEREEKATRSAALFSTDKAVSMSLDSQVGAADIHIKEKTKQSSEVRMRESSVQGVQGLWYTAPGAETSITLKAREKSEERSLLSTAASEHNEVSLLEERTREFSDSVQGMMAEQQRESTIMTYGVASMLAYSDVKKPDSETSVSEQIPEKVISFQMGKFKEITKEEATLGLAAQTIQPPKEQFEQESVSISTTGTIRIHETMRASQEHAATQAATLIRNEELAALHHIETVKEETLHRASVKATEDHQVAIAVDKSKQEQKEGKPVVLAETTIQKGALTTEEARDEAVATMLTAVDTKLDTEATFRSHALEIERTIRDVVATSDAVTEALCELSLAPSDDATRIVSDSKRASDSRRLEISEQKEFVELAYPTQTADVTGQQSYFHQERQESVHREFGSEESTHVLSLSRIEAPAAQREHDEVTKRISRTLSVERRLQATTEDLASISSDITAEASEAHIQKEVTDFYRAKSVGCLKAATEEKTGTDRHLSRSEHELRTQREFRTSRDEMLSSQKYKEFISEVQGLTTQWDIIETDQAALICWKDSDQQSSQLLTKSISEVDIGTTLDLTVRRPARHGELELPLEMTDSTVRQLSVDETQTIFSLQRSASQHVAEHTAADLMKCENRQRFHEYGEDSASTSAEFGKIRAKTHSQEDITKSLPDVRKFVQVHSTMASKDIETSTENLLRRESQIESSVTSVVSCNQTELQQRLAATKETALSSTIRFQRQDSTECAGIVGKERILVQGSGRMPEAKDEVTSSQYETHVDEMSETKTFAVENRASSMANLRGVEEVDTQSSMSIGRGDTVQIARASIPLKSSEMQERKFQIEMTRSEKHLERVNDEDISESINKHSLKELTSAKLHEYGDEKTQICTLFGKIVQKKYESDEAEGSFPMPRRWLERFSSKAAGDEMAIITLALRRAEEQVGVSKVVRVTNDLKIESCLKASTSEATTTTTAYSKSGFKESATIKLRGRSKERAEKKLHEQEWNLQSTASEWQTILNDLEAEVTKAQALHESFRFSTKAASKIDATSVQQISKDYAVAGTALSMTTASTEKQLRAFSIDHEDRTLQIHHVDQDFAEIEQLVDEINRESGVCSSFREYGHADSGSGITLVRRTLPKTRESCSHVVSVSTSLQQRFATQAAGDDRHEAVVELTLPSSSLKTEFFPKTDRKESASLSTKHSTDFTVTTTANYNKCTDRTYSTMTKRKHFIREKSSERLREAEDGAVEILSKWEGIERDLEAEVYLPKKVELHPAWPLSSLLKKFKP